MKKSVRIVALIGAILLAALYICTLIFALIDTPAASDLLKISVAATIVLPVLLYGFVLFHRLSKKDNEDTPEE